MHDIPERPDQIGAEWLEGALAEQFPGVRVASLTCSDLAQGTNQNARIQVEYKESAGAPRHIFAKLPPNGEPQRSLVLGSGMGRREVLFYRELTADLPLRVPQVYVAEIDEASQRFVLLIEDIEASGCHFPDLHQGVGIALARQAMDDLAALHEHFSQIESKRKTPLSFIEPLLRQPEFATGMLQHALARRRARMNPASIRIAELYVEAALAVHDVWETGDRVVTHGDTHLTNLFVENDRLGYFDWGCFARAPAIRDVSYFICMALSIEDRQRSETDLLERYLSRRKELGGQPPSLHRAWEDFKLQASYTVIAAAPTLLHPDERDTPDARYARLFSARAMAAVADHASDERLAEAVSEQKKRKSAKEQID
jgi:aminoglycoside phosphotransferase (APT) family kinase protein